MSRSKGITSLLGRATPVARSSSVRTKTRHWSGAPPAHQWCRIWPRNNLVRSFRGLAKNDSGSFCSTISPRSIKITRSATARAKPISWVTHSMVMPSRASSIMTSSTSLTISGSSAEVGSSNSMILGRMQSARAIATRCCWPPESWPGYFSACSGMRTRFRRFMATSSASRLGIFFTQIGARVRFSRMVRCGKRLNDWNTMPTSRRIASMFLTSLVSVTPSTTMSPAWCSSRRLMQRIKVDLPEPEGPQITIFSPSLTSRLMSLSTWNWPNHLLTPVSVITDGALLRSCATLAAIGAFSWPPLAARSLVELDLEILAVARHRETEAEIDEGGEQVDLAGEAGPGGVDERLVGAVQEVEDADDQHQRRVLEEANEGVDQGRDHHAQRLRQDDQQGLLHVVEAHRVGGLELALGQRLQAAANDLGDVGAGVQDDGDLGARNLSMVTPLGRNSGSMTEAM